MRLGTVVGVVAIVVSASFVHAGAQDGRQAMRPWDGIQYRFGGPIGSRIQGNVEEWLKRAPADNPGMLEMFALRDDQPPLHLLPWSGQFVGTYVISGALALDMSGDPALKDTVAGVVDGLIELQAEDGYLGPFPNEERLAGRCWWDPEGEESHWDLWAHYNVLYGLLLWHDNTGDERALRAAERAADLICATFLDGDLRFIDARYPNQNGAIGHALLLLHRKTADRRYLRLAEEILTDYEVGGEFIEKALQGVEYYQIRNGGGHWGSLHLLQGAAEYFLQTGKERYKKAFLHHWHSINKTDVHNTGAFSTSEHAVGNPWEDGAIETCCVVAWMQMTTDALRLTGDPRKADALELALLNALAGAQHPSGDWWTYMTQMDGRKLPSWQSINFQSRPASPELNCCSVNGPVGLGALRNWAVMRAGEGLVVNYYGPMEASVALPSGDTIKLVQKTDYPISGRVKLGIEGAEGRRISLSLRVPEWSSQAVVRVGEGEVETVSGGRYHSLTRRWSDGDRVTLDLDMPIRFIEGGGRLEGHVSLYRGPVLLAMDSRFNPTVSEPSPVHGWVPPWTAPLRPIDRERIPDVRVLPQTAREYGAGRYRPWVLAELPVDDEESVMLCDFATAGYPGSSYRTWLKAGK